MSISTECPECGKRLKAPDTAAGRKAKCPQCGTAVRIPQSADGDDVFDTESLGEDDGGEVEEGYGLGAAPPRRSTPVADRRPCPMCGEMIKAGAVKCRYCGEVFEEDLKRSDARMDTVRTGVGMIYYGLLTLLGSAILGAVVVAVLKSPEIGIVFLVLAGLGMIAMFVGKLMCLGVPAEVGATGLIYTSVGLDVLSLASNVARIFTELPPAILIVVGVGGIASNILFLVFLKRLCEFIRRSDLIDLAGQVITLFASMIGAYILFVLLILVAPSPVLALFGGIGLLVLALVTVMRYGRLLTYLKDAL